MANIQHSIQFPENIIDNTEIWKPIPGWEDLYKISNTGKVLSIKNNRIIKNMIKNGYENIEFWKNNKRKHMSVHRLIAEAFIPNPENKPHINHINSIRNDNRIENLEWCTPKENIQHSHKFGGAKTYNESKKGKKVPQFEKLRTKGWLNDKSKHLDLFDSNMNFIKTIPSQGEAAKLFNCKKCIVAKRLKTGHRLYGFYIKYSASINAGCNPI